MKELAPDDVEALFRINGLSTFTLGFNQMFCLMLTHFHQYPSEGVVVQYIIYSNQLFNLLVTLAYFSSSISGKMKGMTKIEAMKYNLRERMQRDNLRYQYAIGQDSLVSGAEQVENEGKHGSTVPESEASKPVKTFHRMVENQIKELAGAPEIDLSPFSMEQKFALRKELFIKQINSFQEATAV